MRCILHGHNPHKLTDVGGVPGCTVVICADCGNTLTGRPDFDYDAAFETAREYVGAVLSDDDVRGFQR